MPTIALQNIRLLLDSVWLDSLRFSRKCVSSVGESCLTCKANAGVKAVEMDGARLRKTPQQISIKEEEKSHGSNINSRPFLKTSLLILSGFVTLYAIHVAWTPCPIDPKPFITNFTIPRFVNALTPNHKLQNIERLYRGKIQGPDSIVKDDEGNFYTGLADGRIIKILPNGVIEEITRTGKKLETCATHETEPVCGRPLGLRFDKSKQHLYICDAYYGLLRLNIKSRQLTTLLESEEENDGLPFRFMNDVAVGENDTLYFTDSSWKWTRRYSRYAVLEATGRGRLVSFNMRTRKTRTLVTNLLIPNGLEMSADGNFLLVAETTSSRITKYFLKGPKTGAREYFAENLPGYPANIRSSPKGGYWLGLIAVRRWPFSFLDIAGPYPILRRILAKMMSQDTMTMLIPKYGMIIKLDDNGTITDSLHDPSGKYMDEITDVYEDAAEKVLYLGSYKHEFLGRLKINS